MHKKVEFHKYDFNRTVKSKDSPQYFSAAHPHGIGAHWKYSQMHFHWHYALPLEAHIEAQCVPQAGAPFKKELGHQEVKLETVAPKK